MFSIVSQLLAPICLLSSGRGNILQLVLGQVHEYLEESAVHFHINFLNDSGASGDRLGSLYFLQGNFLYEIRIVTR